MLGTLGTQGLGYVTTFDSPHFEKAPALGKRDVVREYVPIAHRHGIKVLAYLNLHWYAYDFAAKHPDCEQLLADGTPYGRKEPLYGDGTTFCVNSPWRSTSGKRSHRCRPRVSSSYKPRNTPPRTSPPRKPGCSSRIARTGITSPGHIGLCRSVGGGKEAGLVIDQGGPQLPGTVQERRNVSAFIVEHEYPGCLDMCSFGHVPVRVLWDIHLTPENLAGLKVLILPNVACLTDEQLRAVEQYVLAGGNLFATFESGQYDEWGDPVAHKNWLRFLGIDRVKGVFVPSRHDEYLTTTVALDDICPGVLVPWPVTGLAVQPTRDASDAC